MQKLSTGQDATLGSYLKLCEAFFGADSVQARFIRDKINSNPNGANEEVVADESQMLYLLANLPPDGKDEMEGLLQ